MPHKHRLTLAGSTLLGAVRGNDRSRVLCLLSWLGFATWNFASKQKALYDRGLTATMGPFCFHYENTFRVELLQKLWPGAWAPDPVHWKAS